MIFFVDVCSGEAPEEFYDSSSLGSPRAVPPKSSNSPHLQEHLQDDIGVGSLVEVATDVDQNYYGVVRWIGLIDGKYIYIFTFAYFKVCDDNQFMTT